MLRPLGRYSHPRWETSSNCPRLVASIIATNGVQHKARSLHSSPPRSPSISGTDRVDPMLISHVQRKAFATTPSHSEVYWSREHCRRGMSQFPYSTKSKIQHRSAFGEAQDGRKGSARMAEQGVRRLISSVSLRPPHFTSQLIVWLGLTGYRSRTYNSWMREREPTEPWSGYR